jgi:malate dehydrogenase (oxaloacetate-decarboxylating)(NADP+)
MDPKESFCRSRSLDVLKAANCSRRKGLVCLFYWGTWNYFGAEKSWIETEVPIIDTQTDEEDARRNRFANIYWGVRKRRGISLLDAQN